MSKIQDFSPLWGEWVPVEKLGEGSFGTVWKISRKFLNNQVFYAAVKHISIPQDEREVNSLIAEGIFSDEQSARRYYEGKLQQLANEISIMYKLQGYTNIVSYEDHLIVPKAGGAGYDVFLRMELLRPLSKLILKGMSVEDTVKLGKDIGNAIQVLNSMGLIHRDIKPQNLFVNDTGAYKLGDYGTARALSSSATAMSRKGTYIYMAPEIFKNEKADATVDLYSLGLVLYRLVNGNRLPFLPSSGAVTSQQSEDAMLRRMRGEPLPPPAYADPELSHIILKACAYRPEDRYRDAKVLIDALNQYEKNMETRALLESETEDETVKDGSYSYHFSSSGSMNRDSANGTGKPAQNSEAVQVGDVITFGEYKQDHGIGNGKKPIEWIVLDRNGSKALLISKYGLDTEPYHTEDTAVTWEACSLRKWLNNDFLGNAFTEREQKAILNTDVDNGQGNPLYNTDGGNRTQDRVFLLSWQEACKLYFPDNASRTIKPTAYAAALRAYTDADNGNGWWFLRSPGKDQLNAAAVCKDGRISTIRVGAKGCVRPALWVQLESVQEMKKTLIPAPAEKDGEAVRVGDTVTFGKYEQENGTGNGKKPIEWIVLDRNGNNTLLVSKYGLDVKPYNTENAAVTWETCSLRKWLNNDFVGNAFTESEQKAVLNTDVDNGQGNPLYNTDGGNRTQDRVFLLSWQEACKLYFPDNASRTIKPTAYAAALRAYTDADNGNGWWFLRSPGKDQLNAAAVSRDGRISTIRVDAKGCVRPAIWVKNIFLSTSD